MFKSKVNIHPDVVKHVNKFNYLLQQSSYAKSITDLEIHFSTKLPYTTLAVCVREPLKTPVVYINKIYWDDATYLKEIDKEEIVFHELGHCVLNRGHETEKTSIMYPHHLGPTRYQINYSAYINELFKEEVYSKPFDESSTFSSTIKLEPYAVSEEEPTWRHEPIREEINIWDLEEIIEKNKLKKNKSK